MLCFLGRFATTLTDGEVLPARRAARHSAADNARTLAWVAAFRNGTSPAATMRLQETMRLLPF